MLQNPKLSVETQGHTDNQGPDGHRMTRSDNRAKGVCQYLALLGVAAERMAPRATARPRSSTAMLIGLLWIAVRIFQSRYEEAMEKRRQYSFARDMHHTTLDALWKLADATYSTNVLAIPQTLRHGGTLDKCAEHRMNTWRRRAFISILALLLIAVLSIDDPAAEHMRLIVEFVSSLSKLISVFL